MSQPTIIYGTANIKRTPRPKALTDTSASSEKKKSRLQVSAKVDGKRVEREREGAGAGWGAGALVVGVALLVGYINSAHVARYITGLYGYGKAVKFSLNKPRNQKPSTMKAGQVAPLMSEPMYLHY